MILYSLERAMQMNLVSGDYVSKAEKLMIGADGKYDNQIRSHQQPCGLPGDWSLPEGFRTFFLRAGLCNVCVY